jgi:hypothetical protein
VTMVECPRHETVQNRGLSVERNEFLPSRWQLGIDVRKCFHAGCGPI